MADKFYMYRMVDSRKGGAFYPWTVITEEHYNALKQHHFFGVEHSLGGFYFEGQVVDGVVVATDGSAEAT